MARIGVAGLGTMGAALALNIADKGFDVAVQNRTDSVVDTFMDKAGELRDRLTPAYDLAALAGVLKRPRTVIIMVPAGEPVDQVIEELLPHLERGDILIDGGNADFNDTRRRADELEPEGIGFLGMGVSGGEEGARHGPSIMVGGTREAWEAVADILRAIAAQYEGEPCAAHLGSDGAGHFVKTVHNGIEYADMQLIAEIVGLLRKRGAEAPEMAALFRAWNEGPLRSYLTEITAQILDTTDPDTGRPILDVIVDSAGQKGTGRWTVIEALKLGQSATTIESAVAMRAFSAQRDLRADMAALYDEPAGGAELSDDDLRSSLMAGRIVAHAQGFSLLAEASGHFGWSLDLARVAEIWRAGCIIRSALLDDIATAAREGMPHDTMLMSEHFAPRLRETVPALRRVACAGQGAGSAVGTLSAALAAFDTLRHRRGTADLIQAQRDFFGRHGFERVDREGGGHHGPWAD